MAFTLEQIQKINKLVKWMKEYNNNPLMYERSYRYGKNALRAVPIADLNVRDKVRVDNKEENVYYERNLKDATDFPDLPNAEFFKTTSGTGSSSELEEYKKENGNKPLDFNAPPLIYFQNAMNFVLDVANHTAVASSSVNVSAIAAHAEAYIAACIAGTSVAAALDTLKKSSHYADQWPLWLATELKKVKDDLGTEKAKSTRDQDKIKKLEAREKVLARELDAYSDDIVETFRVFKENGGFAPMESVVAEKDQANEKKALKFIHDVHNAEVAKTGYGRGPLGTGLYGTGIYKSHRAKEFGWADFLLSAAGLLLAIPFLQYLVLVVGGKALYDRVMGETPMAPTAANRYFAQAGLKPLNWGDWSDKVRYWPGQFIVKLIKTASWLWANAAELLVKMPVGLFKFLIQHHKWSDEGFIGSLKRGIDGLEAFLVNVFSFPAILANHTLAALEDVWDQLTSPVDEDSVIELYHRFNERGGKQSPYTQDNKTEKWLLDGQAINWENHSGTVTAIVATKILRGVFDTIPTVLSRAVTSTLRSILKPFGVSEGKSADAFWEAFRIGLYVLTALLIAVIFGWALIGASVGAGVPLLGAWLGTMFTGIGTAAATVATAIGIVATAIWGFMVAAWMAGITFMSLSAGAKIALTVLAVLGGVAAVGGVIAKVLLANKDETSHEKLKFADEKEEQLQEINKEKEAGANRTASVLADQTNPLPVLQAFQDKVGTAKAPASSARKDDGDIKLVK